MFSFLCRCCRITPRNRSAKTGRKQVTQDFTHKELANHVYALISQNVVPVNNWGVYLFDSSFDGEQELRNKIGTVWLGSLYDTIEQQARLVPVLRERARALGLDHLDDVLDLADAVMEVTKDVLALFCRGTDFHDGFPQSARPCLA